MIFQALVFRDTFTLKRWDWLMKTSISGCAHLTIDTFINEWQNSHKMLFYALILANRKILLRETFNMWGLNFFINLKPEPNSRILYFPCSLTVYMIENISNIDFKNIRNVTLMNLLVWAKNKTLLLKPTYSSFDFQKVFLNFLLTLDKFAFRNERFTCTL